MNVNMPRKKIMSRSHKHFGLSGMSSGHTYVLSIVSGFSITVTKKSPAAIFAHEAFEQVKEMISML